MKHCNPIFLFFCSLVPGAGQMYLGYMKRGLSLAMLMTLDFCATYFSGGALAFFPVLWMYAFFDTYNLRAKLEAGTAPQDALLLGMESQGDVMRLLAKRHHLVGWGLILLGAWSVYQVVLRYLWRYDLYERFPMLYEVLDGLPRLLVCLGVVALGIWLVRGPRLEEDGEDDMSYYTAAQPEEPASAAPSAEAFFGSRRPADWPEPDGAGQPPKEEP